MPSTVNLGRPPGSALTDTGTIGQGALRASTYGRTTRHLWLKRLGAHLGKFGSGAANATVRLALYEAASNGDPTTLLAMGELFTVSSIMTTASEGFDYEFDVDNTQIYSGTRYAIALKCDNNTTLAHGMVQLADSHFPSGQDALFRDKTGVALPPNPFGSFTPHTEGVCSFWAICETNDSPTPPTSRSLLNGDTLTPTFEGDFIDNNGTATAGGDGIGDKMQSYRVQVRRSSDNVLIWNPAPFNARSSEVAADRFSRVYAGNTLVRGTAYEWRAFTTDQFGASSDWSSWLSFTISSQGTLTAQSTPSGKQDTLTPGPFTARWTHASALAMTHARVIIEYNGKTYLDSGSIDVADVASSASPGTLFTESFATMFPGKVMTSGDYKWRMLGQDSAGNWSNDSNKISFSVDKSPDVPNTLIPQGATVTSLPLLTFAMGDDDDTAGTGLAGTVEILNASGTLLQTRAATWAGGETWEYQTTSADVPSFATYRWRAYGFDGFLYSGGVTTSTAAIRSAEASFVYSAGPSLTIVAPLDGAVVGVTTPTLQWTAPTQTQWKIRIYDGATMVYATNGRQWTQNGQQSYQVKPGFIHNSKTYRWELDIGDASGNTAQVTATFDTDFAAGDDVTGFAVIPYTVGTAPWADAIRGDWDPSTDPDFVAYLVYRNSPVDPVMTESLFYITSVNETSFIDFHPRSGIDYTYTLKVLTETELEFLQSDGVSGQARVDLGGIVLSSVLEPYTLRAYLTRVDERTFDYFGNETTYKRWGDNAPTTIRGRGRWHEISITALLADDAVADAAQRRAELEAIALLPQNVLPGQIDPGNSVTSGQTYCYRDERSVKLFVSIPAEGALSIGDLRLGRASVTLRLRGEAYNEGLTFND